MYSVLLQVKPPDINVVYQTETSDGLPGTAWNQSQERPHFAGIEATALLDKLDSCQDLIPVILRILVHPDLEIKKKDTLLHHHATDALQGIWRESLPVHRLRHVLIPEPGKAMICGHEEILATDMGLVVKRRLVTDNRPGIFVPELLRVPGQLSPGGQGAKMHHLVLHL